MAIRLPRIKQATQILRRSNSMSNGVPKDYCAVYVGETQMKRYIIPVSLLNQPSFQELLSRAEEEFSFNHPVGELTIPCSEGIFVDLISHLTRL